MKRSRSEVSRPNATSPGKGLERGGEGTDKCPQSQRATERKKWRRACRPGPTRPAAAGAGRPLAQVQCAGRRRSSNLQGSQEAKTEQPSAEPCTRLGSEGRYGYMGGRYRAGARKEDGGGGGGWSSCACTTLVLLADQGDDKWARERVCEKHPAAANNPPGPRPTARLSGEKEERRQSGRGRSEGRLFSRYSPTATTQRTCQQVPILIVLAVKAIKEADFAKNNGKGSHFLTALRDIPTLQGGQWRREAAGVRQKSQLPPPPWQRTGIQSCPARIQRTAQRR